MIRSTKSRVPRPVTSMQKGNHSLLHPGMVRCRNELGFKMVKWITAIEFVHDFADLGAGQGDYNEDQEFYGCRMPI
jgi:sulfoxide reductase catalytic subunit YedY